MNGEESGSEKRIIWCSNGEVFGNKGELFGVCFLSIHIGKGGKTKHKKGDGVILCEKSKREENGVWRCLMVIDKGK